MSHPLLVLARPRMLPLVWLVVFFGYMVGLWEAGVHPRGVSNLARLLFSWTLLHAGTMWLNAARDRDAGPVAFGQAVRVPPGTHRLGVVTLLLSLAPALSSGPTIAVCAGASVCLSLLYSHPSIAWKGHPIGGPAVNVLGYGILSPLAGIAASRGSISSRTLLLLSITAFAVAGLYFAAQAFQEEEDRARGDRTLVATHGPVVVLRTAQRCFASAGLLAIGGTLGGWFPLPCLLALPLAWRVAPHLRQWSAKPGGGGPADIQVLLRRLLHLLALLVCLAFAEHIWDLLHGELPAGRNTRVVPEPWIRLG